MAIFRRDPEIPFFDCGVIDPNPHPENIGGKIEKARARVVDFCDASDSPSGAQTLRVNDRFLNAEGML